MLTALGKLLRKARIDRNLLLKDMALGLEVSPAYLSTVETGKKTFSDDFVKKVAKFLGYAPGSEEFFELEDAAALSRGQVQIGVAGVSSKHKEVALAFSRQFEEMQPSELDKLLAVLNESQKMKR
ncbi:helix-turn-helix transcriptional regulator [Pseudomonas panipatensis]|uniref:Helix-turn-helix domain-containing protein n=1 Tax=Pseudomonas panipatensis TaxID=428992 RepID=A0A1G8HJF2_9PSED|nr:helix-turn-helix transcriptional regulator [Pseudomonas panipatensis]SDI06641.1 Helix-turn-helix domain-containing protein [Pseudomonas panipatensis]SMP58546.1 Helix-turn-helix domain-containing protein [Pseudomonas panipatensis]